MCVHVCSCVCMRVHACACMRVCMRVHVCDVCTRVCMCAHACACVCMRVHVCVHVCACVCMCVHACFTGTYFTPRVPWRKPSHVRPCLGVAEQLVGFASASNPTCGIRCQVLNLAQLDRRHLPPRTGSRAFEPPCRPLSASAKQAGRGWFFRVAVAQVDGAVKFTLKKLILRWLRDPCSTTRGVPISS